MPELIAVGLFVFLVWGYTWFRLCYGRSPAWGRWWRAQSYTGDQVGDDEDWQED